ncbi:MAG: DNA adenine methylase [Treponema sp.]|nr:DNA adenine methylase [Treponema sp.]
MDLMKRLVSCNFKGNKPAFVEPYAGGAGIALGLLLDDYVSEIHINDLDKAIYWFWRCVIDHSKEFIKKIRKIDVTLEEWYRQKEIYGRSKEGFDLGFAAFFLNRCNHSGIIAGGCIGGLAQGGKYKIDCRFNKDSLIERIKRVSAVREKISLYNEDAAKLLTDNQEKFKDCLLYLDPPYFEAGRKLYRNHYNTFDHENISKIMRKFSGCWIISYDNNPFIVNLYKDFAHPHYFGLAYSANSIKEGKEVMLFSKQIKHTPDKLMFTIAASSISADKQNSADRREGVIVMGKIDQTISNLQKLYAKRNSLDKQIADAEKKLIAEAKSSASGPAPKPKKTAVKKPAAKKPSKPLLKK